jgi:hypothetical protein
MAKAPPLHHPTGWADPGYSNDALVAAVYGDLGAGGP